MRLSRRSALILTAGTLAMATGCHRPPADTAAAAQVAASSLAADASAPPRPLPRYQTIPQLSEVLAARMRTDRTASFTDDATVNALPPIQLTGEGTIRIDDNGFWTQTHQLYSTPGASDSDLWVVLVPGAGYFKAPPEVTKLPVARPWIAVHPGGTDGATQQIGPLVDAVRQSIDPTRILTPYGDALTLVQASPDQLDSTPTMRYLVRLNVARGQLVTPEAGVKELLGEVLASGVGSMDSQLWLDARNRLVQMAVTAPVPSAGTTVSTRVRYSHWGEPVTIAAPPANQLATN
jgi:hypothetical protein